MALDPEALSLPGELRSKGLERTRENEELRKLYACWYFTRAPW